MINGSTIESMERETAGERIGGDEVQEMQRVISAWQVQATDAQKVLQTSSCKPEEKKRW